MKKLLVLLIFTTILLFGCSDAEVDNNIDEVLNVESQEKTLEEMDDSEIVRHMAEQYTGYFLKAVQTEIGEDVSQKDYIDVAPHQFEEYMDDKSLVEEFIYDILLVLGRIDGFNSFKDDNNLILDELRKDITYQKAIESIDDFVQKYIPEYKNEFLSQKKQYFIDNPAQERPIVEFQNVGIKEDAFGNTFIGEIINNETIMTFGGFAEITLYKNETLVDIVTIVIRDIPPKGKGTFETLPTNTEFDRYEVRITTPHWTE